MTNRSCGDCTLCCRLLPVVGVDKPANTRCRHQTHKGCAVYGKVAAPIGRPRMPLECKLWSCRWLVAEGTRDMRRPDRSHYVVDVMPDFVIAQDGPEGEKIRIEALQVWVDPHHRDAHRDPALRAYLAKAGEDGLVTIVRFGANDGFTLVPPALSSSGDWQELISGVENQHSVAEIFALEKLKVVDAGDPDLVKRGMG